jgi:hypothetical protein
LTLFRSRLKNAYQVSRKKILGLGTPFATKLNISSTKEIESEKVKDHKG